MANKLNLILIFYSFIITFTSFINLSYQNHSLKLIINFLIINYHLFNFIKYHLFANSHHSKYVNQFNLKPINQFYPIFQLNHFYLFNLLIFIDHSNFN